MKLSGRAHHFSEAGRIFGREALWSAARRGGLHSKATLSERGDFEEAFRAMATIRPQVDRFFDRVLVMTEDARLRKNRSLLLLRLYEDVFTSLADLAEIVAKPRSGSAG